MGHDRHPNKDRHFYECADFNADCVPTIKVWAPPPNGLDGKYCEKCGKYFPKEEDGQLRKG